MNVCVVVELGTMMGETGQREINQTHSLHRKINDCAASVRGGGGNEGSNDVLNSG